MGGSGEDLVRETCQTALEEELRAKSESLEAAQELASVGSWDFNVETQTGSWSKQLFEMFDRDPALGEPPFPEFLAYLHPDDRDAVVEHQARAISTGERCEFRFRSNPENGPIRHFVSTVAARSSNPAIVSGAILDETDSVHAVRDLERLRDESRRRATVESLAALSAGLVHDFGNLLMAISTNAGFLSKHLAGNADATDALRDIEAAAERGASICRNLGLFSGGRKRPKQKLVLTEGIAAAVSTFDGVDVSVSEDDRVVVLGDPTLVEKLVSVILKNAVEASDKPISITCGATATRGWFEVRDSGPGMTDEVRERATEPFFTTKFQGRGLGLAAALGIVNAHGGTLVIRCPDSGGTVVRVELPLAKESD